MKTFPTAFSTEKNKTTGAAPVWILKFSAGGADYYISDNAFTIGPWSVTTLKWAKSWGQLQEGISGTLDEFRISDFTVDLLIDLAASPNMETLVTTYPIEASTVSLYLWFYGCSDPPREMFRGYIKDVSIPDETLVQLAIQDESLRLERAMIGTKVTCHDYPSADPDDVGKVIPVPFGTMVGLPALAVNAGIQTSLPAPISTTATGFTLTSGAGLSAGTIVQIDTEQIEIISISGNSITNCVRGYNSTTAATHQMPSILWERKSSFDYLVSAIPVGSIPKVQCLFNQVKVDITSICTRYTGQVGSIHASYPGKAVVTIPGYITASQTVDLLVTGGLTLSQANDVVNAIGVTNGLSASAAIAGATAAHNHISTLTMMTIPLKVTAQTGSLIVGPATFTSGFPYQGTMNQSSSVDASLTIQPTGVGGTIGTPKRFRFNWVSVNGAGGLTQVITSNWSNGALNVLSPLTWSQVYATSLVINIPHYVAPSGGSFASIMTITMDVEVDLTASDVAAAITGSGSVTFTGSLPVTGTSALATAISGNPSITGNSVANTLVGDQILCDVVALTTSIPDVYSWLLSAAGYPGTCQMIGTWPACYAFNGAITEYQSALYWLNDLAFQCRAWFKLSRGTAQLIYRPDTLSSAKTLATCRISGGRKVHSRKKTIYDEILNTVSVLYNRDWSQAKGASAYQAVATGSDATSVTNYGDRERAELFQFDFVTDPTMAGNLQAFYLTWYAQRHWLHEFDTFLYDAELEFGDGVTMGFTGGAVGQLLQTQFAPGSSTQSDIIGMEVVV